MWSSFQFLEQHMACNSLLLPLSFTVIALIFMFFRPKPSPVTKSPPTPSRLPIIGNLHQLGLHPHRSFQSLARTHGPVMLLHLGSVPVLVVSSAEAASEIMKTQDIIFASRPKSSVFDKLVYDSRDVAMAPYGEHWRQMKSLCVVHLLCNKRVQRFRNVREEETARMIEKIKMSCSFSSSVNLSEIFAAVTNDVICRAALGKRYSEKGEGFKELLENFVELLGCFYVGDYIPWLGWVSRVSGLDAKLEKVARKIDHLIDGIVEEHAARLKGGSKVQGGAQIEENMDFVDVLLRISEESTDSYPINRTSVKAVVLDVFAAGSDTTYTVLEWTMTELLRHPRVMNKLQSELRTITESEITEDCLGQVHYLRAVIREALRLHPPVPLLVARESTQDATIKGFNFAAGTQVLVNAWAIGRDPEFWDRAEEFWPERFLNSSIDYKGNDFHLIPFGAGRRICPGIQFVISTIELVLAKILQKFDWARPDGACGQDLDTTEAAGLTVHRKFPLTAVATPYPL